MLFQDRRKLRALLWVIAISIGFYGLKGGVWALRTGGENMVIGPSGSFIEGNTEIGLALNMVLPILFFLRREEPRRWLRHLLLAMFAFSIIAIIFTYSRGAILCLPVVLTMLFLRARRWVVGIIALGVLAFFVMRYPPEQWFSQIETIETYKEDASAMGRLISWQVAWRLALDHPFTGGGFWALPHEETFAKYAPGYPRIHSAHSIYFAVLGDHGFPGLLLFVGLIVSSLASTFRLRQRLKNKPDAAWLVNYCQMIDASLVAYAVSGAFLTQAYWDLFYSLVAVVALLKVIARKEGLLPEPARSKEAVNHGLPVVRVMVR